jgi:hypothetical protein
MFQETANWSLESLSKMYYGNLTLKILEFQYYHVKSHIELVNGKFR